MSRTETTAARSAASDIVAGLIGRARAAQKIFGRSTLAEHAERGITEIARPVGVVAAAVPSTNPGATPANNIINALKCGNAVIVAPPPQGYGTCAPLLRHGR